MDMTAAVFDEFRGPISVTRVPRPSAPPDGVVIEVRATGVCRSDWHGWRGHDPEISLPHVPGHEFSGEIAELGSEVSGWEIGDRVTVPFSCGCGACGPCFNRDTHLCEREYQPGFSGWGSFAEFVSVPYAATNLVRLPDGLDFVASAALGCRYMTAFRALTTQARSARGEWLAVYGCGGVGLSAVQIGVALGMRVLAVDLDDAKLALAGDLGAEQLIDGRYREPVTAIRAITGGGAHVSIDALGSAATSTNAINSLRRRGRHIQIGLVGAEGGTIPIPMARVISHELAVVGSHGMPAHQYEDLFSLLRDGQLDPGRLVGKTIPVDLLPAEFDAMTAFASRGITVVEF